MVDILLLVVLAVGFVTGLISGAVKQLISFAAFVAGFVIACLYYQEVGEKLCSVLSMPTLCKVVAFFLLWAIVPIVAGLISKLLTSLLDKLFVVGLLNRLLGGTLGVAKYALVLGALIYFFSSLNILKEETLQKSRLCGPLKVVPEYVFNLLKTTPNLPQGGEKRTVNE